MKFPPLFGDHGQGDEAGDPEGALGRENEQQTRGLNQDCYLSANPQICEQMTFVQKSFFFWFRNLLFLKIGHSTHLDEMLLLGIDLLDHLILYCMELLTSFKSCKVV